VLNVRADLRQLCLQILQLVLRARHVELRRQSVFQALLRELQRASADFLVVVDDLQLRLRPAQVDIRSGCVRRQREPQFVQRRLTTRHQRLRREHRETFAAEYIGLPRSRQADARLLHIAERRRRVLPLIRGRRARIELRRERRALLLRDLLRLLHALDGSFHVEVVVEHDIDELVHGRVAELRPPLIGIHGVFRRVDAPRVRGDGLHRLRQVRVRLGLHGARGERQGGGNGERFGYDRFHFGSSNHRMC